jgi:hypothetical protein
MDYTAARAIPASSNVKSTEGIEEFRRPPYGGSGPPNSSGTLKIRALVQPEPIAIEGSQEVQQSIGAHRLHQVRIHAEIIGPIHIFGLPRGREHDHRKPF